MTTFIFALILLAFALFGVALRKTYDYLPRKELKRQARQGDEVAAVLYQAVAYDASLRILLWIFIGLCSAGGFVLLVKIAPAPLAFLAVAGLLWYAFVWVPASKVSNAAAHAVVRTTPAVAWVLNYAHPALDKLAKAMEKHRARSGQAAHGSLFEREDLVELLDQQKSMSTNRIDSGELDMAIHALTFGEKIVGDIMVPRRIVKLVNTSEPLGPILSNELHESGYSRFPVYDGNPDHLVGTLYLKDLIGAKNGGKVSDIVRPEVYYVHEDQSLFQVLHAFIKTKHHLFIVVNSFEEFVGVISIEDVIEQVIGHKIEDEFDKYDDLRAVAHQHAQAEHETHKAVPQTVTEVVE